ncbi:MAG: putative spermidine/putrescine transport system permease protein [Chloroflexota bacterium]|nr:putative spermidine/putrescine transport system permease protein [Chloroflexota bacterium]
MTVAAKPLVETARRPLRGGRRFSLDWLGAVPFLAYVGLFLLLPTAIAVGGSFVGPNGLTLSNLTAMNQSYIVAAFVHSVVLSAASAVLGAVLGAVLAYAVATGNPNGVLRRLVTSACGVLAQFGGVTLAFAFLATIGLAGFVTLWLQQRGINIYANGIWLYELSGLVLVYTYFQIPLMVLVFLPALDGIRPQWREATESLGGGTWHYWRYVAGPLLAPAFFGGMLLLFANSFSAYATAAALISQGSIIASLLIANTLTSEVGLAQPGLASALALVMVVIVAVVMVLYTQLQRRTSKWLQ